MTLTNNQPGPEGRSWSDQKPAEAGRKLSVKRIALLVLLLLAVLVIYAWIDGGEQPLHPIAQPIPLPGQAE